MKKYIKKIIQVEAIQFISEVNDGADFGLFEIFVPQDLRFYCPENNSWYIRTLEGNMKLNIGDYIIKGINGEFYSCKKEIFEKSYIAFSDDEKEDLESVFGYLEAFSNYTKHIQLILHSDCAKEANEICFNLAKISSLIKKIIHWG